MQLTIFLLHDRVLGAQVLRGVRYLVFPVLVATVWAAAADHRGVIVVRRELLVGLLGQVEGAGLLLAAPQSPLVGDHFGSML